MCSFAVQCEESGCGEEYDMGQHLEELQDCGVQICLTRRWPFFLLCTHAIYLDLEVPLISSFQEACFETPSDNISFWAVCWA